MPTAMRTTIHNTFEAKLGSWKFGTNVKSLEKSPSLRSLSKRLQRWDFGQRCVAPGTCVQRAESRCFWCFAFLSRKREKLLQSCFSFASTKISSFELFYTNVATPDLKNSRQNFQPFRFERPSNSNSRKRREKKMFTRKDWQSSVGVRCLCR